MDGLKAKMNKILNNKKIVYVGTILVTVMFYMGTKNVIRLIGAYVNSKAFSVYTMEELYVSSHIPNVFERQVGQELVDLVEECYVENKTDDRLGPLNDFFGSRDEEYICLCFKTCKIKGNRGIVWVTHGRFYYDKEMLTMRNPSAGSMMWEIEKKNGDWRVIKKKHIPG